MISVANTPSSIRHLAPRECNEIVSRCLSCSCKITVKVSLCMCKYFHFDSLVVLSLFILLGVAISFISLIIMMMWMVKAVNWSPDETLLLRHIMTSSLLLSCISPFLLSSCIGIVVVHSVGIGSALAEMDLGK